MFETSRKLRFYSVHCLVIELFTLIDSIMKYFCSSETCEGQFCFLSLTTSELLIESTKFEKKLGDHKGLINLFLLHVFKLFFNQFTLEIAKLIKKCSIN